MLRQDFIPPDQIVIEVLPHQWHMLATPMLLHQLPHQWHMLATPTLLHQLLMPVLLMLLLPMPILLFLGFLINGKSFYQWCNIKDPPKSKAVSYWSLSIN